jgi:hypothetical protein
MVDDFFVSNLTLDDQVVFYLGTVRDGSIQSSAEQALGRAVDGYTLGYPRRAIHNTVRGN